MAAPELDRRIAIQRLVAGAVDAFNAPVETWSNLTSVWARRRDVSDGEKVEAAQVGSMLRTRFKIRSTVLSRTFTPADRISYDGAIWNIHGIKEMAEGRFRYLEITATKSAD